jgi:hypothetical protein
MSTRPTFEARCGNCTHIFGYPSLPDTSYGEAILSTEDGSRFAHIDGFSGFPSRVANLIRETDLSLWASLALLADPVEGQNLVTGIHCPRCNSCDMAFWGGAPNGSVDVPEATFSGTQSLADDAILSLICGVA